MADRTVKVRLEAAVGQYEAAMAKAGLSTKGLGSIVEGVTGAAGKSYGDLGRQAMNAGTGIAAGAALAAAAGVAFIKFAHDGVDAYVELVQQVDDYQDVTGASAEASSRMVAVANVLGVSVDSLSGGMYRLSRNVATQADSFRSNGIEIARNKNGAIDLNGTLLNVAEAYNRVGGGQKGAEIAMLAFGRGGRSLIEILERSRGELEGFWRAAEMHGEIIGESDIENVRKYKIAQRENEAATEDLSRSLGERLTPALTGVTRWTTDFIDKASGKSGWWEAAKTILIGSKIGHDDAAEAAHKQAEAEQDVADQLEREAARAKEFQQALDGLYTSTFGVSEAQDKFTGDLTDFADKVRAAQIAGDAYATSLDESTTTGRENAEMVRGLTKDIIETAKEAQLMGADVEAATARQRQALITVLEQLGFNHTEASKYADVLARLDGLVVSSTVDLDITPAQRKVQELRNQFDFLNPIPGAGALAESITESLAGEGPEAEAERERQRAEAERRAREAKQASEDAARAAREAQAQRDAAMANQYEFGGISADAYKAYLGQRLSQTRQFSDEWAQIMRDIDGVNQDIGAGWTAAHQARMEAEAEWMRILRLQHEFGERTTADYLEQLRKRLVGLEMYSAEWETTMREIKQLEEEVSQSILDIIAAVDKQRRFDEAFYDAASQRQLSAIREGVTVQAGSTTTRSYNPTFNVTTADPNRYSANQQMRDDAFLASI